MSNAPAGAHPPPALKSAFATAWAPPYTTPVGVTHSTSCSARAEVTPRPSKSADCQGMVSQRGLMRRSANLIEVEQKLQSPSKTSTG